MSALTTDDWPGGLWAPCESCGRCTAVREVEQDSIGEPCGPAICRPCAMGWDDEEADR